MTVEETVRILKENGLAAITQRDSSEVRGGSSIVRDTLNPSILFIEDPFLFYQEKGKWMLNYGDNDQYLLIIKVANSPDQLVIPLIQYRQLCENIDQHWLRRLIILLNLRGIIVEILSNKALSLYITTMVDPDDYYNMIVNQSEHIKKSLRATFEVCKESYQISTDRSLREFPAESSSTNQTAIIDWIEELRS